MSITIKKMTAVLLSVLMVCSAFAVMPVSAATDVTAVGASSGITGPCTWTLDDSGTLTISGNGKMADDYSPWGEDIKSVIIKSGVTRIGDMAFCACKSLTSVTIPDSVTSIGYKAFYGCSELTSVTIGVGVSFIRENAFAYTAWYNNQPNGVVYAGKVAYRYKGTMPDNTVVVFKEGTKGIAESAFYDRTGLTSVTIPNSVTVIGDGAFFGCTGLTSVTIPNSVTVIDDSAFGRCTGLKNVTIGNGVKSIGHSAFGVCYSLTSVTIPNSVTSIGQNAFYYCRGLTSVTIPGSVTSIGREAFSECTGLEAVYITDLTDWCKIDFEDSESNPLYNAHKLYLNNKLITDLVIPNSVTSIGYSAFERCTGLTSVTIPNSVTSIGEWAFLGCMGLTSIIIGNGVNRIGVGAFSGCKGLASITIPNNVTSIGEHAFYGCQGLTSVTIPESVTSIGNYAFSGCTGLTSVTIPDSVTGIGYYAFGYDQYEKIPGFTIRGKKGSAAEKYANQNGFTFVATAASPTSVKLNRDTLGLGVGENYGLVKTVAPSNADQAVTWSSSNTSVATVDSNGKVFGKASGTANITVKTSNGKTATCKVTVKPAPTSVKTNPASLTLGVGESYTISESTSSGSYANAANLKWASSNTNVVTVSKTAGTNKAVLKATGTGTANITIKTYNGKTATCKVTVKPAPTTVKTNPASLTLGNGETYTVSESTDSGSYANAANLSWSSSNTKVATVTKGSGNKATIKAVGTGTANITIKLYNGKTATCKVTVKPAPTSVKTNPTTLTLNKGKTYTISESTNSGSYANAANLKWTSTNTKVATVTKGSANKATVKAVAKGTAYIKITLYNGKTAQCKVTVK